MRRDSASDGSSLPRGCSRRAAIPRHRGWVVPPPLSSAQPFTVRIWPFIWSVFIWLLGGLHPAAALVERGNFLHACGQYSTVHGHALGALVGDAPGAKDVPGERRRLLDHHDIHGAQV